MSASNRLCLMLRPQEASELAKLWAEKRAADGQQPDDAGRYMLIEAASTDDEPDDLDDGGDDYIRYYSPTAGASADRFLRLIMESGRWRPGEKVSVADIAEALGIPKGTAAGWARILKREGRWPFLAAQTGPSAEVLRARVAARVEQFLKAVKTRGRWRPGDAVSYSDAAKVAGVSITGARDYIKALSRQGRWPYVAAKYIPQKPALWR